MAFTLNIKTGKQGRAQKVVIYAPEGFGKSTFANQFPGPLTFDLEGSTSQMDVARVERKDLPNLKAFMEALAYVAKEKPCATIIIDTVDWLEMMIVDALIREADDDKIKGIEDFGYGKGYTALKERMTIIIARLDAIVNAGIHVVLLAHSTVKKTEPPDGAGPYDRYELKMSKQVAPLIKEWCDLLIFGNWRVQVKERDTKKEPGQRFKAVGGKERVMHCVRRNAWDAKNRHGLSDTEKWDVAILAKAFQSVAAPWSVVPPALIEASPQVEAAAHDLPCPAPEVRAEPKTTEPEPVTTPEPEAEPEPVVTPEPPVSDGIPGLAPENGGPGCDPIFVELQRILGPHEAGANCVCLKYSKIAPGETWRNAPIEYLKRILQNPAGFLKLAKGVEA